VLRSKIYAAIRYMIRTKTWCYPQNRKYQVHNISQRRRMRTEPRPQAIWTKVW